MNVKDTIRHDAGINEMSLPGELDAAKAEAIVQAAYKTVINKQFNDDHLGRLDAVLAYAKKTPKANDNKFTLGKRRGNSLTSAATQLKKEIQTGLKTPSKTSVKTMAGNSAIDKDRVKNSGFKKA
jgi:hypothetical protein